MVRVLFAERLRKFRYSPVSAHGVCIVKQKDDFEFHLLVFLQVRSFYLTRYRTVQGRLCVNLGNLVLHVNHEFVIFGILHIGWFDGIVIRLEKVHFVLQQLAPHFLVHVDDFFLNVHQRENSVRLHVVEVRNLLRDFGGIPALDGLHKRFAPTIDIRHAGAVLTHQRLLEGIARRRRGGVSSTLGKRLFEIREIRSRSKHSKEKGQNKICFTYNHIALLLTLFVGLCFLVLFLPFGNQGRFRIDKVSKQGKAL